MTETTPGQELSALNVLPQIESYATEIMPGVFLGSMSDARLFQGARLCVRDEGAEYQGPHEQISLLIDPPKEHKEIFCLSRAQVEKAATYVKHQVNLGVPVLVHCLFGRDRSPMVIAWWLVKMGHMSDLDTAYRFIQAKRPVVIDRQAWLEPLDPELAARAATGHAGWIGYPPQVKVEKSEQAKYQEMWTHQAYREVAPGELCATQFMGIVRPKRGAKVLDFGAGTGRGAVMLAMLGALEVKMLDFASNCLDDFVVEALQTQPLLSFDLCNLVKPIPFSAEYGYCTDVMEHIPPEWVTTVLVNILKSAQHVFFQIACDDDQCGKIIGEKLHLTVEPIKFWLDRLQKIGAIVHWSQDFGTHCMIYCTAWAKGEDIVDAGVLNITVEQVRKNAETNLSGQWRDIGPHEPNDTELAILGGGPSLAIFEDEIRQLRGTGVSLITLNGVYNWAHEKGLFPVNQFVVDARPHNARFTKPIDARNQYFIASQCDPAVLEGLPQERTFLWHAAVESIRDLLDKHRPDLWFSASGGSTILLRAIPLLRMMGFKKFYLYGCDSCLENGSPEPGPNGEVLDVMLLHNVHHSYKQPENDNAPVIPVIIKGRTFYCHPWMISQAQEFITLIKALGDEIELCVKGDGLLAWIIEAGAQAADEALFKLA